MCYYFYSYMCLASRRKTLNLMQKEKLGRSEMYKDNRIGTCKKKSIDTDKRSK